jgi:hypothetical protein
MTGFKQCPRSTRYASGLFAVIVNAQTRSDFVGVVDFSRHLMIGKRTHLQTTRLDQMGLPLVSQHDSKQSILRHTLLGQAEWLLRS